MRQQNIYPAVELLPVAGTDGPKVRKKISRYRKLSHSAENQLTAPNTILIHCQKLTLP